MQRAKTNIKTNPKKLYYNTGRMWISESGRRNNQEGFKEKFIESVHHTSLKTNIQKGIKIAINSWSTKMRWKLSGKQTLLSGQEKKKDLRMKGKRINPGKCLWNPEKKIWKDLPHDWRKSKKLMEIRSAGWNPGKSRSRFIKWDTRQQNH